MLIIFIDAYPFERASELEARLTHQLTTQPLRPGFGYSVNLHNELFSGLGPDEIGYFGEWNFVRYPEHGVLRQVGFALVERFPSWFRLWRLFLNKIARIRKFYIPSRFSKSFERKGVYPFSMRHRLDNVLERYAFDFCVADIVRAPLNRKDVVALDAAFSSIRAGNENILVSLCDLDGLFHEYGTNSNEVTQKIGWLSEKIEEMTSEYLACNPNADVVVLSDHGICDVDRKIELDLSRFASYVNSGKMVYFYDSLYLLLWTKDSDCREKFIQYVANTYDLVRLTDEDRREGRLRDPKFGDEIFVCPEGACFSPNYFGFRTLKAYHGYHPAHSSSHGILMSNFPIESVEKNTDVYRLLSRRLDPDLPEVGS